MAQGATGFLKKVSPIKLKDVTIESSNDYATVTVVSLDGKPLKESRSVLVQVGTTARPTGWVERETTFKGDDGKQTYPGQAGRQHGKDALGDHRSRDRSDHRQPGTHDGHAARRQRQSRTAKLKVDPEGGRLRFAFPAGTLYVVLEAN